LLLVGLTGVLLLTFLSYSFFSNREPRALGKPLSYWLQKIGHPEPGDDYDRARKAINIIGTNAVPHLTRMIRAQDSLLDRALSLAAEKCRIRALRFQRTAEKHYLAATGFGALGELSTPIVQELSQALPAASDDTILYQIVADLQYIGPEALPALLTAKSGVNGAGMLIAGATRTIIEFDPHTSLRKLLKLANDDDPGLRAKSAGYLPEVIRVIAPEYPNPPDSTAEDVAHDVRTIVLQLGRLRHDDSSTVCASAVWALNYVRQRFVLGRTETTIYELPAPEIRAVISNAFVEIESAALDSHLPHP
jgi:hypothetical protein